MAPAFVLQTPQARSKMTSSERQLALKPVLLLLLIIRRLALEAWRFSTAWILVIGDSLGFGV